MSISKARLCTECIDCIIQKYLHKYPSDATRTERIQYVQGVLKILADAKTLDSAPILVAKITELQARLFGALDDYDEIKRYFNAFVLGRESELLSRIGDAHDPLLLALTFAMIGNYVDFGVLHGVAEQKLIELLQNADNEEFDTAEVYNLKADLSRARSLVYLTDNCGEIALDKLFVKTIKGQYPDIDIEVIVRGAPVLNDATLEDAYQVGFDSVANVSDNGSDIAGTVLELISESARRRITDADVVIAKGQGNFETLVGCGLNVYYMFLCKCDMFANRFNVPRYTPMILNDKRI